MASEAEVAPSQRVLRVLLYVLTALAALAALFVEPALAGAARRGAVPSVWTFLPLSLFVLLFALYSVDRIRLVRSQRYPAGRAFVQAAVGVLFALVLFSSALADYRGERPEGTDRLLLHVDPELRATAVYAIGFHGPNRENVKRLELRLDDRSPEVRKAAAEVLARWSQRPPEDLAGIRAWASASSRSSTTADGTPRP